MTCAALLKLCPWVNVVLVESDKPTVGVGESTLGHINKYMRALGLEDKDWMLLAMQRTRTVFNSRISVRLVALSNIHLVSMTTLIL